MEESPLHAFELHNLIPLVPAGIDISINKAVILMWIVVGLVAVVMISASAGRKLVPGKLQNIAELIVEFIRGIILDTMGEPGMKYFPLIATLFLFILFANPPLIANPNSTPRITWPAVMFANNRTASEIGRAS